MTVKPQDQFLLIPSISPFNCALIHFLLYLLTGFTINNFVPTIDKECKGIMKNEKLLLC